MMIPFSHRLTGVGLQLFAVALVLLAAGCTVAPARETSVPGVRLPGTPVVATPTAAGQAMPILTPIPGIKATLTALPKQLPMSASQARPYQELRGAVERCSAYNENRKLGILNQIDYVLQPATVPSDFVVLYGDAWQARMIYGAAYLSALEWKLAGRDRVNCLYPIGVSFNALLRDLHQEIFPEFE